MSFDPAILPKAHAAKAALQYIEDGMKVGLGTGSTAAVFVDFLAEKIEKENLDLICVPTSEATAKQAQELGMKLTTLDALGSLDVTVDGADEITESLDMIKGGGAALLREKIVAEASNKVVTIADSSKLVEELGAFKLPIEVIPFGCESTMRLVKQALGKCLGRDADCQFRLLEDGSKLITDEGNYIIDAACLEIKNPKELHDALDTITGVVECGLFISIADIFVLGTDTEAKIFEKS